MLFGMFFAITNYLLPRVEGYAMALYEPILELGLYILGIVIMLSIVGIHMHGVFGAIFSGLFRAIGYICRIILAGVGWILRNAIRAIPRVYRESRRIFYVDFGVNAALSTVLALVTVIVFLIIII